MLYATRYHQLCWDTHGSGLAGVRSLNSDVFTALIAMALGELARLAALIGELALRALEAWTDEVEVLFKAS